MVAVIVYPNSLFEENKLIEEYGKNSKVYIVEEPLYFTKYKYHKMKLVLHRSSMKYYKDYIDKKYKIKTKYVEYDKVEDLYSSLKNSTVHVYDPVEHMINFDKIGKKNKIEFAVHDSPLFLQSRTDLSDYIKMVKGKKITHAEFYKFQRKKHSLLLDPNDNDKPMGGKWSFDTENRKKFPTTFKTDIKITHPEDKYIKEAKLYVNKNFSDNPGSPDLYLPITFAGAKTHFKNFIKQKLQLFGKYEDAVSSKITFGYHSVLSPLINIGLITPHSILEEIKKIKVTKDNIASIEGYVRQVIGWREYCNLMYFHKRTELDSNFFDNQNRLPKEWYTDKKNVTGFDCVDDMITKTWENGYLHHIERLMYIGNYTFINEILPKDVFTWFQTMFIDSYHVFMYPNVYGMSQHASGPIMMTRPYFSSSNYISKMSNYKKNDLWDSIYYNFINNKAKLLEKNYSTAIQVKNWKKKSVEDKKQIIADAKNYKKTYL